jgi:zinc transport system ATP-binding protein
VRWPRPADRTRPDRVSAEETVKASCGCEGPDARRPEVDGVIVSDQQDPAAPAGDVLEVSRLSIRFGENRVVTDLSFRVPAGTSLAIIGPNGAGKTVLFKALIGAIPSDGTVRWAPGVRIGYVPQKLDLERDVPITGVDFLRARAALAGSPDADVGRALALVGVPRPVGDQPIGTLSGGQFQRLLVAFALVGHPTVLLLDEPTAGVDEPGQERLNELVHRLQVEQGLTALFISHELTVVYRYATSVLCLGREQACFGAPRTILTPELLHEIYGTDMEYHVHDR